jgi:hypothetical protein
MMAGTASRLRLRARDKRDLQVIASVLQDALVAPSEISYLPEERRFVAILNRFRWETALGAPQVVAATAGALDDRERDARFAETADQGRIYERVHSALCVDRVLAVRQRGIARDGTVRFLELLTLAYEDRGIVLRFASGAEARLETRGILCHLEDLGEPWPTPWRPRHPDD